MILQHATPFFTGIENPLLQRGAHLIAAPTLFIASAVDVIIGLGVAVAAICTLAQYPTLAKYAFEQLSSSSALVRKPWEAVIRAMNPKASIDDVKGTAAWIGWASKVVYDFLPTPETIKSYNGFQRHIIMRLAMPLVLVAHLVTRAVDAIVGTLAAVLSILTGGHFASINAVAVRALQAPAIIVDVFLDMGLFLKPS